MTELIFSMPSTYYYALAEIARAEDVTMNESVRRAIEEYGNIRNSGVAILRERLCFISNASSGRYRAEVDQSYIGTIGNVQKGAGVTFNQAMEIIIGQYVMTYAMNEERAKYSPSTCV